MISTIGSPPACLRVTAACMSARTCMRVETGLEDAEPATARAEHRVRLAPELGRVQQLGLGVGDLALRLLDDQLFVIGQELVQRRVEQADRDGQPVHRLEDADEVGLLLRAQLLERGVFVGVSARIMRCTIGSRSPRNMCSVRQRPMPSAPNSRALRVFGEIGVGAHLQAPVLVGPAEDRAEVAGGLGRDHRDLAEHDLAGRARDRDHVAFVHRDAAGDELLRREVDLDRFGAADRGLAHAARDHRRVRHETAARREDALGRDHAVQVVGRGLGPHEDHVLARLVAGLGVVGGEVHLADRRARRRVQALREHVELGLRVELRVQELIELGGLDAQHRLALVDQALARPSRPPCATRPPRCACRRASAA